MPWELHHVSKLTPAHSTTRLLLSSCGSPLFPFLHREYLILPSSLKFWLPACLTGQQPLIPAFIVMVNQQLEYQVSSHSCATPSALGKVPGCRQCQSSQLWGSLSQGVNAADSRYSQQQGIMLLTACEFGVTQGFWQRSYILWAVSLCFWSHINFFVPCGVCSEFCSHLLKIVNFGLLPVKAKISLIFLPKGLVWRERRSRGEGNRDQADLFFHIRGPARNTDNLTAPESCLLPYPFQKPSLFSGGGNSSWGSFSPGWEKLEVT